MFLILCDECRGEVRFVTSVASFGTVPGARFYQCETCGHLQVQEFTSTPPAGMAAASYSDGP